MGKVRKSQLEAWEREQEVVEQPPVKKDKPKQPAKRKARPTARKPKAKRKKITSPVLKNLRYVDILILIAICIYVLWAS